MKNETTISKHIVRCPKCGANNRVSSDFKVEKMPLCGRCKTPLPLFSTEPLVITDANFGETVEKSVLPVLIDFWAAWCGPCRTVAPVIDNLAKELAGKVTVGKLDVDQNQRLAARFRVQSIPTLLILQNGNEVDRLVGVQSKETILRRLQPYTLYT